MKKNLLVSLVATILVFAVLGLVELCCRVFTDINYLGNSSNLFIANDYGNSKGNTPNVEGVSFGVKVYTDEYGFRISKNKVGIGKRAILILGDSVAFGSGIDEDKTFVGLLKKQLTDVKVYNSSVIGYNLNDYKNVVDYFVPKHNEIKSVYLIYCLNDLTSESSKEIDAYLAENKEARSLVAKQKLGENRFVQSINSFLRSHSKLYLLLRQNMGDISLGTLQYDMQAYEDNYAFNNGMRMLSEINDTLRKQGIEFIVIILPYEAQLRFVDKEELRKPQKIVARYLGENGIKYLDVFESFRDALKYTDSRELYLYRDAMHLSVVGHRLLFQIVFE